MTPVYCLTTRNIIDFKSVIYDLGVSAVDKPACMKCSLHINYSDTRDYESHYTIQRVKFNDLLVIDGHDVGINVELIRPFHHRGLFFDISKTLECI